MIKYITHELLNTSCHKGNFEQKRNPQNWISLTFNIILKINANPDGLNSEWDWININQE